MNKTSLHAVVEYFSQYKYVFDEKSVKEIYENITVMTNNSEDALRGMCLLKLGISHLSELVREAGLSACADTILFSKGLVGVAAKSTELLALSAHSVFLLSMDNDSYSDTRTINTRNCMDKYLTIIGLGSSVTINEGIDLYVKCFENRYSIYDEQFHKIKQIYGKSEAIKSLQSDISECCSYASGLISNKKPSN